MAVPTNTERIQRLSDEFFEYTGETSNRLAQLEQVQAATQAQMKEMADKIHALQTANAVLDQRCAHLERTSQDASPARLAVVEQRCATLEKHVEEMDRRRWQIALAFAGCLLTLAVQVVLVFVKKV